MSAYIIARIKVTDPDKFKLYQLATPDILKKYKGTFLVRGGDVNTLEGIEETARIVVIEFPDQAHADAFYSSAEYTAARKLREGAATAELISVDGI